MYETPKAKPFRYPFHAAAKIVKTLARLPKKEKDPRWVALNINRDELALVCMIFWGIWLNSIPLVHGRKGFLGRDVIPSLCGCVKLNSNAAMKPDSDFLGIGAIIRNDRGQFLVSLSKPLRGRVEVDVVNVACTVQFPCLSLGVAGLVLNDILALCLQV
ncbi:hypothetical protein JRO89_XS13G0156900 [Xanthoceras sorbifolium]|uniref:RNase H type-1 domain-containing protein n=1 Tax=Xanthoceras sorbifolium TaxID=99658 RepID=A0ABQ8H8I2_9ROSI|nr:hypothetical protein JRO89_XS13G0156900 [Xanthoceras sorbifolium]